MRGHAAAVLFVSLIGSSAAAQVDMAIGFDKKTDRPNAFIAWRNTERILEVELEVKNLGRDQAGGSLALAILDEEGRTLATSPGPKGERITVMLPPRELGGDEGRIVQMHGSKELNLLIDRLDRANARYYLQAEVIPDKPDPNPANNRVVKSFNVGARLRPAAGHYYDFYWRNTKNSAVNVVIRTETSKLPDGWRLSTRWANGETISIPAGGVVQGYAMLTTPETLQEGEHLDIRFLALDPTDGSVTSQSEWFVVYDSGAPEISELTHEVDERTGGLRVALTANDPTSMLKEASGVRVEYSTDGGTTFSNRVLAYLDGNFVGPTRFGGDLGPFAPGTKVVLNVVVDDIAGNKAERRLPMVTIPSRIAVRQDQ